MLVQTGHVERFNRAVRAALPHVDAPRFIESDRLAPFTARGADVAVVLDLMIHDIDLVRTLVGGGVREVRATGVSGAHANGGHRKCAARVRVGRGGEHHGEPRLARAAAQGADFPAERVSLIGPRRGIGGVLSVAGGRRTGDARGHAGEGSRGWAGPEGGRTAEPRGGGARTLRRACAARRAGRRAVAVGAGELRGGASRRAAGRGDRVGWARSARRCARDRGGDRADAAGPSVASVVDRARDRSAMPPPEVLFVRRGGVPAICTRLGSPQRSARVARSCAWSASAAGRSRQPVWN